MSKKKGAGRFFSTRTFLCTLHLPALHLTRKSLFRIVSLWKRQQLKRESDAMLLKHYT